jgi:integrase
VLAKLAPDPGDTRLDQLAQGDAPILLYFAVWLKAQVYRNSTILQRLAGVQSWLQFADNHGWLPHFPLTKARQIARDETRRARSDAAPPEPPTDIEQAIYYYDHLTNPYQGDQAAQRWELERLRNRALMYCLAESAGRVSEVLQLNLAHFPPRCFEAGAVLRVGVAGKGGHSYDLRLLSSLPAILDYVQARGVDLMEARKDDPVFVLHGSKFDGQRMSRHNAGYVVKKAAKAIGQKDITPHQFRHWRASQLVNAGIPLDVVQDYLGHRSVETTRRFYARTDPGRVDEAVQRVSLPSQR